MAPYGNPPFLYEAFTSGFSGWDPGLSADAWSITTPPGVTNGDAATCAGEDNFLLPIYWLVFDDLTFAGSEILVRCQTNTDTGAGTSMGVLLRGAQLNAPGGQYHTYQAGFADDAPIGDQDVGGKSLSLIWIKPPYIRIVLSTAPFIWNPNAWYWIRFRVNGNSLRAKAWEDGKPEPTNWLVSTQDDSIQSGAAGVFSEYEEVGARQFFDLVSLNHDGSSLTEAPAFLGEQGTQIPTAEQFFSPDIGQYVIVTPPTIGNGQVLAPTLAFPLGATETIPSEETFFQHGIHDDVDTLLASLIPSAEEVYQPTTLAHATAELIDDGEVYAPRIKRDWVKPEFKSTRDEPVEHWDHESLTNRLPRNQG